MAYWVSHVLGDSLIIVLAVFCFIRASELIENLEAGGGVFSIINTSAGDCKIVTTNARANEIVEYYSNATRSMRPRRER